ncbi:MAG: YihY/virulence factor BrkB family protein [Alphaproteobacteria bacterium]|uniref:YihY/virulence factor BrkB family protein n=1 Tax=Candidatus Nitrobium versatile TaxID=2884831 RepID=A0A953J709_9BACT|nr:YihY/virulence factor BrkB family protein [Candidatus Nitrobium versatile]
MWEKINEIIIRGLWGTDLSAAGKPRAILIMALRLLYGAVRDISEGQLTLRAMGLVYTTLLSLVPLLAVSFSVLKAFGVHNQVRPLLYNFLAPLGEKGSELTERIIMFVEKIDVTVLGYLGLVTLLYTVVSVIQKIEGAFNYIWKINKSRSFMRRFSDYLSVLLIGPVLIFSALGVTASLLSTSLLQKLFALEPFGTLVYIGGRIVPYLIISAAFTFVYLFIPNTKVKFVSALVGGAGAGILWETSGWAFASFIVSSKQYSAIYSGFAIILLFMIWIYLSWLILLVGASIAFYHQFPRSLTPHRGKGFPDVRRRERLAFLVMYLVGYNHYYNAPPWTLTGITEKTGFPVESVWEVLDALVQKGLLVETCDDPPLYLPRRDSETVLLKEIYASVIREGDGAFPAGEECPEVDRVSQKIDDAVDAALEGMTLKSFILSCGK